MIPYEKFFTIVVEAKLIGAPTPTWNSNVAFTVLIEDPCPYDQVSIPAATAIQSFTYYLAFGNAPLPMSPVVMHRYPECLMSCNLYQDFFGMEMDYPWELIWMWEPFTPTVEFLAEDKFMSGMFYDLIIRCEIDPRAVPDTAENRFTVTLMDECFDVQVTPLPSRTSYSIDLYFFDMTPFTPAGKNLFSCNEPTHEIKLVTSTAIIPADFWINNGSNMIETDP